MTALRTVLGWLAAAALLAGTASQAAVVYNNGGPDGDPGNDATFWVQAEDLSFAAATTIGGAGVYIAGFDGLGSWDGTMDYSIFADAAGQVGALQVSGAGQNVVVTDTGSPWCCGGNAYLVEFDFMADFLASAGTRYWFGIHLASDFADADFVSWLSAAGNGTPTGAESAGGTFDNWVSNETEHAYFLIGPRQSVPEPSGLALVGLAFMALAVTRRRRHRPRPPASRAAGPGTAKRTARQ